MASQLARAFFRRRPLLGRRSKIALGSLVLLSGGFGSVVLAESDTAVARFGEGTLESLTVSGRGIVRSSRAIRTMAFNSLDYKLTLMRAEIKKRAKERLGNTESQPEKNIKSEIHRRSAERLLRLCEENRGIYIKAGQFLASLQHLPKEYSAVLSVLQDQARGRPFHEIEKVLKSEFGKGAAELFLEFEEIPIAAASLAQVHRARLKDGQRVAVKIQYPHLESQVKTDIVTMAVISKAVAWLFPGYHFGWIVPQFQDNLHQQLDFCREAQNAEETAANFRGQEGVKVPDIHWDYTTRRVLTMEFVQGCKIDDLEGIKAQGLDPEKVAARLVEVFAQMVFCHGHLHGDPHPGNILVHATGGRGEGEEEARGRTEGKQGGSSTGMRVGRAQKTFPPHGQAFDLVLLDHGLYRELDSGFRLNFCRLWKSLILMDAPGLDRAGQRLGAGDYTKYLPILFTGRSLESKSLWGRRLSSEELEQLRREMRRLSLGEISSLVQELPEDLFLVMRTDNLVRQHLFKLGISPLNRLITNGRLAARGLLQYQIEDSRKRMLGFLESLWCRLNYFVLLFRLELWQLAFHASHSLISLQSSASMLSQQLLLLFTEWRDMLLKGSGLLDKSIAV